jgi:hypothetical protein
LGTDQAGSLGKGYRADILTGQARALQCYFHHRYNILHVRPGRHFRHYPAVLFMYLLRGDHIALYFTANDHGSAGIVTGRFYSQYHRFFCC